MKKTIPEIREELISIGRVLVKEYGNLPDVAQAARRIMKLARETKRRTPNKRAPVAQGPIKPMIVLKVRRFVAACPEVSNADVARRFGLTNGGRVTDIVSGKRSGPVFDKLGRRIAR